MLSEYTNLLLALLLLAFALYVLVSGRKRGDGRIVDEAKMRVEEERLAKERRERMIAEIAAARAALTGEAVSPAQIDSMRTAMDASTPAIAQDANELIAAAQAEEQKRADDPPLRKHWRLIMLALLAFAALAVNSLWSADGVADSKILFKSLLNLSLALAVTHIARKVLHPYIDMRVLFEKAKEGSIASAVFAVGVLIFLGMVFSSTAARAAVPDKRTYIPVNAHALAPIFRAEQQRLWPDHPLPSILMAQAEHESCISLTHSKCMSPKSRLKTYREEGCGIPQLTRTFNSDGSIRFDTLADLKRQFPRELDGLSWSNCYERADLQIRAMILLNKRNYNYVRSLVSSEMSALVMSKVAYNAGPGRIRKDRDLTAVFGDDPNTWFRQVEKHCTASRRPLYGNRSACDIMRHYPADVIAREAKYRKLMAVRGA